MSLLGEQLAEEWLNRRGYFTIRGAKVGTGEIDILAIRCVKGVVERWHYEVQASLRPISYLCPAPKALRQAGKSAHNAKIRPRSEIETGVDEWVEKKFFSPEKERLRKILWPGEWRFGLIIGNVKHPEELELIKRKGIEIIPIAGFLRELSPRREAGVDHNLLDAAGGSDLIDLVFAESQLRLTENEGE